LDPAPGLLVRPIAPVHFEEVTGGLDHLADARGCGASQIIMEIYTRFGPAAHFLAAGNNAVVIKKFIC
jgi:hypothetical protein